MPDPVVLAVIVEPTIGQQVADWHRERFGRPAPGMPAHLLGYAWTVRDVVHMRDRASGQARTEEEARAAAELAIEPVWCADSAELWLEETRHRRDGSVSLEELAEEGLPEVDLDLERVRAGVFDQEQPEQCPGRPA